MNGGPAFEFNEAVFFIVNCETQQEIDYYLDRLLAGGEEQQCGWLKDRFGHMVVEQRRDRLAASLCRALEGHERLDDLLEESGLLGR